MKKQKIEFSKKITMIPYFFLALSVFTFLYVLYKISKGNLYIDSTILANVGIYFVAPSFALATITNGVYANKTKSDNIVKQIAFHIRNMIKIQREHPELEIYPVQKVRQDAQVLDSTLNNALINVAATTANEEINGG